MKLMHKVKHLIVARGGLHPEDKAEICNGILFSAFRRYAEGEERSADQVVDPNPVRI